MRCVARAQENVWKWKPCDDASFNATYGKGTTAYPDTFDGKCCFFGNSAWDPAKNKANAALQWFTFALSFLFAPGGNVLSQAFNLVSTAVGTLVDFSGVTVPCGPLNVRDADGKPFIFKGSDKGYGDKDTWYTSNDGCPVVASSPVNAMITNDVAALAKRRSCSGADLRAKGLDVAAYPGTHVCSRTLVSPPDKYDGTQPLRCTPTHVTWRAGGREAPAGYYEFALKCAREKDGLYDGKAAPAFKEDAALTEARNAAYATAKAQNALLKSCKVPGQCLKYNPGDRNCALRCPAKQAPAPPSPPPACSPGQCIEYAPGSRSCTKWCPTKKR